MGLFDRFRKQNKNPESKSQKDPLSLYNDIRVEVYSDEDDLLFAARLHIFPGGTGQLRQLTGTMIHVDDLAEENDSEQDSETMEPLPVKLRGFHEERQRAVHMEGEIDWLAAGIWRVTNLRVISSENDRAFYRQKTYTTGLLSPLNSEEEAKPCTIVNISAGGIGIQTKEIYELNEKLSVRFQLMTGQNLSISCEICRILEKQGGVFEYGCRFLSLDSTTEEQISRAIIEMQMKLRRL